MPLTVTEKPNFTPSDSDLARRVSSELSAFCRGFRRIEAWAESGIVTLSGPVKSYYSRQMAVVTANRVGGVHRVIDNLDVDLHPLLPCLKERNMRSPENFIYHCVTCGRIARCCARSPFCLTFCLTFVSVKASVPELQATNNQDNTRSMP